MNEELLKRLDALAAKLGVTGAHLWDVLVRQARIEATECITWALIWLTFSAVSVWCTRWLWKRKGGPLDTIGPACACLGLGAVCLLISFACLSGTPGMLLNPEYWALQQVLKAAAGK